MAQENTAETGFVVVETIRNVANACKQTFQQYHDNYVKTVINTGRDFAKQLKQTGIDAQKGIRQTSVQLRQGVKSDLQTVWNRGVETLKTSVPGKKMAKDMFNKLDETRQQIVQRIQLPGKAEMERLNQAMDAIYGKVELLTEKHQG